MALSKRSWKNLVLDFRDHTANFRFYSSKVDLKKMRSMILKRIENRAKDYPVKDLVPVANDVLKARMTLIQSLSVLIQVVPVVACKFCPEVHVGEKGHLIQTCWGHRRGVKNRVHEWITGGLNDILVPVETFRLNSMFQKVIKHDQRFDYDRVSAVVELCRQAGADVTDENLQYDVKSSDNVLRCVEKVEYLSPDNLKFLANGVLSTWEILRLGVQKLLLVYPAKVCKYCSEIHVGPSGHKARQCGIFKYESWRGSHFWQKAGVNDLVPQKMVWRRRPQDPLVLLNEGREFYGHAPAIVDMCSKAGATIPTKYACMMKIQGLPGPL
ncbi:APO protein 4, mitochondrial [Mercurialis annua]|uniref:APO protein 4, mitochondrial n=1 Tax=Mercurialis annua TaxID=3986 RepID=UPI00215FA5F0|nr:APO protein 4, mitochondrial [Mercurialis annua]XP_050206255.1 APO protein 4, mitochondrial [Mercurialis annua]XP_050206256.1 APO protein 4, mitochondrial [Mercurialis annua]XP_050206257.1 APO protein 4, mitochondrial [Mercurialis annua]XP_050206258.1 APO protein 4, mitochondrial [Mercurialis annua]XP_050206259.1 APO protein 4, mitochondrial [Mercurialis annua]XP_050206262.1 APO protein 4, mitochondrial [Mercurialis annua]